LCNDANTIADLNKKAGSDITWYDGSSGGTPRTNPLPTDATTTLYAELSGNCAGAERIRVEVTVGDCSSKPTAGLITTFVKVMYDFQHQKLEAYKTSGGNAISFKWQVSTTNNFVDIPGAPNSKYYTVPANFYADALNGILSSQSENVDVNGNKSLNFRCELKNPNGEVNTTAFNIIFINTSSYATDPVTGMKYVTLGKGSGGDATGQSGTMKMLLLNLGQSGDSYTPGSSDAGDLGDFYQWGRVADGHEHIVWSKNASHINQIEPMDGTVTSAHANRTEVIWGTNSNFPGSYGQVPDDGTADALLGKYITGNIGIDWGSGTNSDNGSGRWAKYYSTINRTNFGNPSKTANDPCPGGPTGWKVPSQYNWWDFYVGTGLNNLGITTNYADCTDNIWQSFIEATNRAIGGVIITSNATGEQVFLPATGYRYYNDATLKVNGEYGRYWSSTYGRNIVNGSDGAMAHDMGFYNERLTYMELPTGSYQLKVMGLAVRCVAD
jgi:hypothetical protein